MAKLNIVLALFACFSIFILTASEDVTGGSLPNEDVKCPSTIICEKCVEIKGCTMMWFYNNTNVCLPSVNVTDEGVTFINTTAECKNMDLCKVQKSCNACLNTTILGATKCEWCVNMSRCASSFTHVPAIGDLITDIGQCAAIITTTPPPTTTTTTTTTTTVPTTTTTTSTPPPTTTTPSKTTTVPPTPTPAPTTTSTTPAGTNVTTLPPVTTEVPPTPVPSTDRRFDGPSFIGGIVLAVGCMAISFVAWKFYKARTERNYHTL